MKVYVVTIGWNYDDFDIKRIYSTYELAESKLKEYENCADYISIVEYKVNTE